MTDTTRRKRKREEVQDFPRGGDVKKMRVQKEGVQKKQKARSWAQVKQQKNRKNVNAISKKMDVIEDAKSDVSEAGIGYVAEKIVSTTDVPSRAFELKAKYVEEGMLLLGVIKEISEFELLVSLPDSNQGVVSIAEISDTFVSLLELDTAGHEVEIPDLDEMFQVGQFVRVSVMGKSAKGNKLELTMRESVINNGLNIDTIVPKMNILGSIKSVEDHGFIVSFGLAKLSGFLLRKNVSEEHVDKLAVGHPLDFVVLSVDKNTKTVQLSQDFKEVKKTKIKSKKSFLWTMARPGLLLDAKIIEVLPNGLWVQFMGYFSGSVNLSHLGADIDAKEVAAKFHVGSSIKARIIIVDIPNKRISLSLNKSILKQKFTQYPYSLGDILDGIVYRVDSNKGVGIQLTGNDSAVAYSYKNLLSDKPVKSIEKLFPVGTEVKCRILSFNEFEGMATVSLKEYHLQLPLLRYDDVKIGDVVTGDISFVNDDCVSIKLTDRIRALCPRFHMGDFSVSYPDKVFIPGKKFTGRVLDVDSASKKIVITHKKSLINSELPIIQNYHDVVDGLITHGYIISVKHYGVLIGFYNGVKGLVRNEHLSGHEITDPTLYYKPGEVKRCQVIETDPGSQKIFLTLVIGSVNDTAREEEKEKIQVGDIMSGVIKAIQKDGVEIQLSEHVTGFVPLQHLSDFSEFCVKIKKSCRVGMEVDVLVWANNKKITLSMKRSLINEAENGTLPKDIEDIVPGKLYTGIISKITTYGVFVQFLNNVYGLATKSSLADSYVDNVENIFDLNQTVVAYCVSTDIESRKIDLNLKPSFCSAQDKSFLEQYLETKEILQKTKDLDWSEYAIGSVIKGTIVQTEDIGYVLSFPESRLTGFAHIDQTKGVPANVGSTVSCLVLDCEKTHGIIDVSLRPELLMKKKMKKFTTGKHSGTIQHVQANYMIISIDSYIKKKSTVPMLVYAPSKSINEYKYGVPFDEYPILGSVTISIDSAPTNGNPVIASVTKGKKMKRELSNISALNDIFIGMESPCIVKNIFKTYMNIDIGLHVKARVHVSEVSDDLLSVHPFSQFEIGQKLPACKILDIREKVTKGSLAITQSEKKIRKHVYATLRPSCLNIPEGALNPLPTWDTITKGQTYLGWVHEVTKDAIWVHLSTDIRGRVFILDVSNDVDVLNNVERHFHQGQGVMCSVTSFDIDRKKIDLSIKACENKKNSAYAPNQLTKGMIVPGRYSRVTLGSCLNIQLFAHTYGQVFITDINDRITGDPLSEYGGKINSFDLFYVLDIDRANDTIYLSLRRSRLDPNYTPEENDTPEVTDVNILTPGTMVKGYVRNCTDKTCYVALSHNITAVVYVSNLSDKYLPQPKKLYFPGRKVTGRVLKVDDDKNEVHLTLKESQVKKKNLTINDILPGMTVKGWVKNITDFGVFISVKHSNLVGLCHISEIDDGFVTPNEIFHNGDYVKAYVLKKDSNRKKLTLSMKPSRFVENDVDESDDSSIDNDQMSIDESSDEMVEEDDSTSDDDVPMVKKTAMVFPSDESSSDSEEDAPVSTSVMWDQFRLMNAPADDDLMDDESSEDEVDTKQSRKDKEKRKKEEEENYREKEDAMLEDTAPKTKEDYEKLILEFPRSSYIWIQYMAYWLNLSEYDQARAIAQRALDKIDPSYQSEKFNIWVALMTLENNFGTKESTTKVFKEALQYSDKKQIYLAAIKMYQNSNQNDMVEELYKTLTKKFKTHKSVWIKYAIYLFKQTKSEEARKLLTRSTKSLPQRKHISIISKFAELEFKLGTAERGRTIYEDLISTYPKRIDIWNIYLDQETRLGDTDKIRALYERVITLDLSTKKMKHFFKRFLKFETKLGDTSRANYVKQKTIEYVESKM